MEGVSKGGLPKTSRSIMRKVVVDHRQPLFLAGRRFSFTRSFPEKKVGPLLLKRGRQRGQLSFPDLQRTYKSQPKRCVCPSLFGEGRTLPLVAEQGV